MVTIKTIIFDSGLALILRTIIFPVLTIALFVVYIAGCAMVPGARLVPKGTLEIGSQASLVVGGSGFPVLPNIGLSSKYGITNRINIGSNLYPLYLFANKTISFEPYLAACLIQQQLKFPAVITYVEFPVFINLDCWEVFSFPLFGIVLNYEFTRFVPYIGYELAVDRNTERRYRDFHNNVRVGISRQTTRKNWISLEVSLNDIGKRSFITNQSVGYPCIQFGISFPVINRHD
jgi:hypothetical protein